MVEKGQSSATLAAKVHLRTQIPVISALASAQRNPCPTKHSLFLLIPSLGIKCKLRFSQRPADLCYREPKPKNSMQTSQSIIILKPSCSVNKLNSTPSHPRENLKNQANMETSAFGALPVEGTCLRHPFSESNSGIKMVYARLCEESKGGNSALFRG